jgi:hydroxyethylthiazole kinase-like uncharacterized protein yjeF
MRNEVFLQLLDRPNESHKFNFGHVLIIGGSPGMVGAPLLAGKASLRTGAGLVTIASTDDVTDKLERRVEEIMTLTLPASPMQAAILLRGFIKDRKVSVLVIGPGLRANTFFTDLVEKLLQGVNLPMVIDAGALNSLKGRVDVLKSSASGAIILTPHLGEFQRLINFALPQKRPELKPITSQFAKEYGVTVALKGHPTFVAHPDGSIYENTTGNPGLATAGTGDVLSGIIAGLISQDIGASDAAEAGVYLHGLAGDIAATQKTEPGMIASDVSDAIPAALKHIASA